MVYREHFGRRHRGIIPGNIYHGNLFAEDSRTQIAVDSLVQSFLPCTSPAIYWTNPAADWTDSCGSAERAFYTADYLAWQPADEDPGADAVGRGARVNLLRRRDSHKQYAMDAKIAASVESIYRALYGGQAASPAAPTAEAPIVVNAPPPESQNKDT